jgi:hypothetical protein
MIKTILVPATGSDTDEAVFTSGPSFQEATCPRWTCVILEVLDRVGRICRLGAGRGGLILTATRDV